jgi:hypothetical protein
VLADHFAAISNALAINLELNSNLTSLQLAGLIRLWHSTTESVNIFYGELDGKVKMEHMKSWLDQGQFYYFLLGAGIVMVYLLCQIDPKKKVQRQFRHAFPPKGVKID